MAVHTARMHTPRGNGKDSVVVVLRARFKRSMVQILHFVIGAKTKNTRMLLATTSLHPYGSLEGCQITYCMPLHPKIASIPSTFDDQTLRTTITLHQETYNHKGSTNTFA